MNTVAELAQQQELLSAKSKSLHLVEFWRDREDIENLKPRPAPVPFLWKWADIHPHLQWASQVVPVDQAERRGLLFANPGLQGKYHATQTLLGAYSLYNPGEHAPVHRHTPCASRFVIHGKGGYTVVGGEKCVMERGDLIITPAGLWHDHGNEGIEPLVWMDVLDLPLVEALNCSYFEFEYFEDEAGRAAKSGTKKVAQTRNVPDGYSEQIYGVGGVVPLFGQERGKGRSRHSPKFHYQWARVREALHAMRHERGSAYEGIYVEYVSPATGRSVMPNMSFRAQMLRPGEHTLPYRSTTSALYCVLEGSGHTQVGDVKLEWQENDVFVVPNWAWREHVNGSSDSDAVLYSVTDYPLIETAGLLRAQGKNKRGEIVDEIPW
jgi:gentisate 1,2-dioxygenase